MSDSPLRIVTSKPPENDQPLSESAPAPSDPSQAELAELRRLLVEPEQIQINNILERLNNSRIRAREMSRVIPEAIRLRGQDDDALSDALSPTIVKAFHSSIRKDPRPVAEAISPLMGPAIRRAITNALSNLIQSFDQTLKYSFSAEGLKWRIEAWRTGKSFAEVALYHMLIFRAEQVFLIHKQTGLLLLHVAADAISTKDADLVSGMLTAIQDAVRNFVRDSFDERHETQVDKLDLGDLEVWFVQESEVVLAVVIRGHAPETLRTDVFEPAIESIQREMAETLASFDGDAKPFEVIRSHLEECLQSRYQARTDQAKFKIPFYIKALAALILIGLGLWGFFFWRAQNRWTGYLDRLKSEPGIIVADTGWQNGKRYLSGLRDPLAADPDQILKRETKIDPNSVISRWEPYQALDSNFLLIRAKALLDPPQNVELKFENGILSAAGEAPHEWIIEARKFARAIPGVEGFEIVNLVDQDLREPEALRKQIEQRVIRFISGSTQLLPGENQGLLALTAELSRLIELAPSVNRTVAVQIIGHTDSEGDENNNNQLSENRALRMVTMLSARGIARNLMTATGVSDREPVRPELSAIDKQFNRSVSFKVSLIDRRLNQKVVSGGRQ